MAMVLAIVSPSLSSKSGNQMSPSLYVACTTESAVSLMLPYSFGSHANRGSYQASVTCASKSKRDSDGVRLPSRSTVSPTETFIGCPGVAFMSYPRRSFL